MLHLAGGVRLGRDVGDLFQLERALERNRKPDVTAEVEEERLVVVAFGDLLDRMVSVEELLHLLGEVVERLEDELDLLRGHRAADLRELQRNQGEQRNLRRERLRRRDTDLEPGARVQNGVDLARHLRSELVRDRERTRPLLPRELHRRNRVGGLPGLGDPDDERVFRQHGIPVTPLACDVRLDGDTGPLLDDVATDDGSVIGGAAGDDHDATEILDLELVQADALEHELAAPRAIADRLPHCFRLLVDLLEHEGLVAALLGDLVVPVHRLDVLVLDLAFVVEEPCAFRRDRDDLAFIDQLHAARLAQEGGDRGSEKHLPVTHADHEWALPARADEQTGMVVVDHDEGVMTFELAICSPNSFGQIAFVVVLDQMDDHLGVRLGAEAMTCPYEGFLQLAIVLDDAVEDDGEATVFATGQRMRVQLGHCAVGRPTRVPEAVIGDRPVRARGVLQELEIADGADVFEPAILAKRDPGRVVTAVLEPLQALKEKLLRRPTTDISDDPAHPKLLSIAVRDLTASNAADSRFLSEMRPRKRQKPTERSVPSSRRSAELSSHESRDPSTEVFGLLSRLGLSQNPNDGLCAGGTHEDPASIAELGVETGDLLPDGGREHSIADGDVFHLLGKASQDARDL